MEVLFTHFIQIIPLCLQNLTVDLKIEEVLVQNSQRVGSAIELLIYILFFFILFITNILAVIEMFITGFL